MEAPLRWIVMGTAMLATVAALAQVPPPPGPPGPPPVDAPEQTERQAQMRDARRQRQQIGMAKGMLERLKTEDPEEFERLTQLYREDRQAFMKEMRSIIAERPKLFGGVGRQRRKDDRQLEMKCHELSKLYLETEDEKEKARLKAELTAAVQKAFEVRLKNSRERVERLEQQLTQFKERIQTLEENRERICQERLNELTRPPDLRWEGNW